MDNSIKRMIQDLARGEYSEKTKTLYLWTVNDLSRRFGHPVANLTVDELRTYADEIVSAGKSSSWVSSPLIFFQTGSTRHGNLVGFVRNVDGAQAGQTSAALGGGANVAEITGAPIL